MNCNPFFEIEPSFRRLFVFGAGGFGREIAWLVGQSWGAAVEVVFLVDNPEYVTSPVNGVPVQLLDDVAKCDGDRFVVAVGDPQLRRRAVAGCLSAGLEPAQLVHPRVEMSRHVSLGDGCVVCAGCILTVNIVLGEHVHINLDCTIGHDVVIGDYATLSPGVHVSGNVQIGRDVFIGTGANIINGTACAPLVIGHGAVIAAGACVAKSVDPGVMVAGVPAVRKR
ncbi:acetyltransferase [Thermomonas fusca]|uniref:Acetyltransferase n=1 Tax=Thermomonas fusca TaxID=215690 RepID=A0A5R9PD08_9GAMM|nr:acetyltransferase [Thermomonas fusca]TLX21355.1 acetyltransferase [Thermomonas fusca]